MVIAASQVHFFFLNRPNSVGSREPNETAKFRFNEVPLTDKVIAPDTAPGFLDFNHVGWHGSVGQVYIGVWWFNHPL